VAVHLVRAPDVARTLLRMLEAPYATVVLTKEGKVQVEARRTFSQEELEKMAPVGIPTEEEAQA
jgi:hypothetical protein